MASYLAFSRFGIPSGRNPFFPNDLNPVICPVPLFANRRYHFNQKPEQKDTCPSKAGDDKASIVEVEFRPNRHGYYDTNAKSAAEVSRHPFQVCCHSSPSEAHEGDQTTNRDPIQISILDHRQCNQNQS